MTRRQRCGSRLAVGALAVVGVCGILIGDASPVAARPRQSSDALLQRAAADAAAGDWYGARKLLENVAASDPSRPEVHHQLGIANENLGAVSEAIASYRQAITLDPLYVAPVENLAALLASHGDLDGALYLLDAAVGRQPDAPSLHYHRALLIFRRERRLVDAAVASLARAHELGYDQPHLFLLLGRVARTAGDASEARELLRQGLDRAPDDAELLREMGLSLAVLGQLDEAAGALEHAHQQQPANIDIVADLATVLLRAKRPNDVLDLLASFDTESNSELLFRLGQAQRALGLPEAGDTMRRFQEMGAVEQVNREAGERAMAEVNQGIAPRWVSQVYYCHGLPTSANAWRSRVDRRSCRRLVIVCIKLSQARNQLQQP